MVSNKRKPAKEVVQDRGDGWFYLDHALVELDDLNWLGPARRLTLWNVRVPDGFLARLGDLWWLEIIGGSESGIVAAEGCSQLRYLFVNQVRGLNDLGRLTEFRQLEFLDLYGLKQVQALPDLSELVHLRRVQIGQMQGLVSMSGMLAAPNLSELLLLRKVAITEEDVNNIIAHPKLKEFGWVAEDVPAKTWTPVVERINLPRPRILHPIEWFDSPD